MSHAGALVVLMAVVCSACTSRVSRALEYEIGSPVGMMIAEVGLPDVDRRYPDALHKIEFCPPSTTRLVEYHRRPLLPMVDEGAEVVVCVDGAGRIAALRSTSPW